MAVWKRLALERRLPGIPINCGRSAVGVANCGEQGRAAQRSRLSSQEQRQQPQSPSLAHTDEFSRTRESRAVLQALNRQEQAAMYKTRPSSSQPCMIHFQEGGSRLSCQLLSMGKLHPLNLSGGWRIFFNGYITQRGCRATELVQPMVSGSTTRAGPCFTAETCGAQALCPTREMLAVQIFSSHLPQNPVRQKLKVRTDKGIVHDHTDSQDGPLRICSGFSGHSCCEEEENG
jgi:hypothetical protein